jgi:hypothetical protein
MNKLSILGAIFATLSLSSTSFAQDYTEFTLNPWVAESNFKFEIDSSESNPMYGSPTSMLDYTGMKSAGIDFKITKFSGNSYGTINFKIGTGTSQGEIIDNDWFSVEAAKEFGGPTLFSSTSSKAEVRSVFGFEIGGGKIFKRHYDEHKIGTSFSYNRERYEAYGIEFLADPYDMHGLDSAFLGERVLGLDYKNYAINFDLESKFKNDNGFFVSLKIKITPISYASSEDYHYKRIDLNLPSVELTSANYGGSADIYFGYEMEDMNISIGAETKASRSYTNGRAEFNFSDKENESVNLATHSSSRVSYNIKLMKKF